MMSFFDSQIFTFKDPSLWYIYQTVEILAFSNLAVFEFCVVSYNPWKNAKFYGEINPKYRNHESLSFSTHQKPNQISCVIILINNLNSWTPWKITTYLMIVPYYEMYRVIMIKINIQNENVSDHKQLFNRMCP